MSVIFHTGSAAENSDSDIVKVALPKFPNPDMSAIFHKENVSVPHHQSKCPHNRTPPAVQSEKLIIRQVGLHALLQLLDAHLVRDNLDLPVALRYVEVCRRAMRAFRLLQNRERR